MIKALNTFVIIEPEHNEEKVLESGIVLPELRRDIPQVGRVIDVPTTMNPTLTVGLRVWYKMWAGDEVEYDKKKYRIVHIKDLIAYEKEEET